MFCKNCGYQNFDDAKVCAKCKTPLYSFMRNKGTGNSGVGSVNQTGQTYYSNVQQPKKKSKAPIIIISSVLVAVLLIGGVLGFLFVNSRNNSTIPEWSDTVTATFADIKKDGHIEQTISKHSFENYFSSLSSEERISLSFIDSILSALTFECSNYNDLFYYDALNDKQYVGSERYYEQNPNIKKPEWQHPEHMNADMSRMSDDEYREYNMSCFKDKLYHLREIGVIRDDDIVNGYVVGEFDLHVTGTISMFGQTQSVDNVTNGNTVELLCINGEWKFVSPVFEKFNNSLIGEGTDNNSSGIIY